MSSPPQQCSGPAAFPVSYTDVRSEFLSCAPFTSLVLYACPCWISFYWAQPRCCPWLLDLPTRVLINRNGWGERNEPHRIPAHFFWQTQFMGHQMLQGKLVQRSAQVFENISRIAEEWIKRKTQKPKIACLSCRTSCISYRRAILILFPILCDRIFVLFIASLTSPK